MADGQRRAEGVAAFMGTLATKLVLLPPKDPESKGVVERRNSWFETSFMLGRTFDSPGDFNAQFTDWLTGANARAVRTVKAAPTDLLDTDRAAMLPLPPIPLHLGWHNKIRLGRDHYVRLDTNDYSVDTHRDSHTAAVIDAATGGVVEHLTVATDVFDYRRLRTFTDVHTLGRRVWAIEGTGSYGSGFTTDLLEHDDWVVEIDRPTRPARRDGAKSDDLDAVRAAQEALSREHLAAPRARGDREAPRVLMASRQARS